MNYLNKKRAVKKRQLMVSKYDLTDLIIAKN